LRTDFLSYRTTNVGTVRTANHAAGWNADLLSRTSSQSLHQPISVAAGMPMITNVRERLAIAVVLVIGLATYGGGLLKTIRDDLHGSPPHYVPIQRPLAKALGDQMRTNYRQTTLSDIEWVRKHNWTMCAWVQKRVRDPSEASFVHCVYDNYVEMLSSLGAQDIDLQQEWVSGLLDIASQYDSHQISEEREGREISELRVHVNTEAQVRQRAAAEVRAQRDANEIELLRVQQARTPLITDCFKIGDTVSCINQ
jgi:hypothetical protein